MLKNKKIIYPAIAAFLVAEAVLGTLVHTAKSEEEYCYAIVLLAFAFNFLFINKTAEWCFTAAALLFTVGADTFLVLLPPRLYVWGMIFFNLAQLSYAARIHFSLTSQKLRRIHLALRLAGLALGTAVPLLILGHDADALSVISVIYFVSLILNAAFACIGFRQNPIFSIGLILFIGCDIFVGFGNLSSYLPITPGTLAYSLAHPKINMAWVFYTPSQALLSISASPIAVRPRNTH